MSHLAAIESMIKSIPKESKYSITELLDTYDDVGEALLEGNNLIRELKDKHNVPEDDIQWFEVNNYKATCKLYALVDRLGPNDVLIMLFTI